VCALETLLLSSEELTSSDGVRDRPAQPLTSRRHPARVQFLSGSTWESVDFGRWLHGASIITANILSEP